MPNTVLILGASGKIGQNAARAFANAGWNVRNYDRKSNDMTTAARGVKVIINGLNYPRDHKTGHCGGQSQWCHGHHPR